MNSSLFVHWNNHANTTTLTFTIEIAHVSLPLHEVLLRKIKKLNDEDYFLTEAWGNGRVAVRGPLDWCTTHFLEHKTQKNANTCRVSVKSAILGILEQWMECSK